MKGGSNYQNRETFCTDKKKNHIRALFNSSQGTFFKVFFFVAEKIRDRCVHESYSRLNLEGYIFIKSKLSALNDRNRPYYNCRKNE